MNRTIQSTAGAFAVCMMVAACTTAPSNPNVANAAINDAAHAVERAATNPHVEKYASSELSSAQNALKQAQATWKEKQDEQATSHLAYLARKRAETAVQLADQRAAQDTVMAASARNGHVHAGSQASMNDLTLERELAGLPARATERGIVVMLPQGRFASGNAALPAGTMPMVDHLASVLKNNPGRKIVIEGYTDSTGEKTYNKALGRDRASTLRAALIRRGVEPDRIIVRSYGEENPIASNNNSAGRRENRRADVVISNPQGQMMESVGSSGR